MFCCGGPKCLGDDETQKHDKGKRTLNQNIYLQRAGGVQSGKLDGKMNSNLLHYMSKENAKLLKPNVKHVTNVHRDVYVKLNGVVKSNTIHRTSGNTAQNYRVVQMPRSQTVVVRHARERASVSTNNPSTAVRTDQRRSEPVRDSMRLSTEFKISSDENGTSTPFGMANGGITLGHDDALAIFENSDTDSLTEEQRHALEHLEDTLNDYHIDDNDDDDDRTPIIVADVLPYGVFEHAMTNAMPSSPESSEDEPSSRSSSLSNKSINSRTGIISHGRLSVGNKKTQNSVSFKLPVDHVDKPYSPMQTLPKAKQVSIVVTPPAPEPVKQQPATVCVSGNNVNIWHSGNTVYVQNKHQRRMSGPFKGSFKSLFYRKYNKDELSGYNESKNYLTPKIMEKVASFESLTGEQADEKYRGNVNAAIVRRNTIR